MAEVADERKKMAPEEAKNDGIHEELADVRDELGVSEKGARSLVGAFSYV